MFNDLDGSDATQRQGYWKIKEACREICLDGMHYL